MMDFVDPFFKSLRAIVGLFLLFLIASYCLWFTPITLVRTFPYWSQQLAHYRFSLVEAAGLNDFQWNSLIQVGLVASQTFSSLLREIFVCSFIYYCLSRYTVISFHLPPWIIDLLPDFFQIAPDFFGPSYRDDDSDLPPLEEMDETPLLEVVQKSEWHVFHPIFGVIPRDVRDLWDQQEVEREALRLQLLQKKQRQQCPPPIRFSEEEEEEEEVIDQSIPFERTLSGFEAVGIE